MKSLKNLEHLIQHIANDSATLERVRSIMPVYEFTVLSNDYESFVQYLGSSKDYNVSSLVDKVLVKSGAVTPRFKADWETIAKLIKEGIDLKDIQEDNQLLAVYARLAVLSDSIANSTGKIAGKLRIKHDLVYGLLTNTTAFSQLIQASIHYSIDSSATVTSTKATYVADITAKTSIPTDSLLSRLARKAELSGVNIVADKILMSVNTDVSSELAAKFLDSAVKEFQGKVTGNDILSEFNSFNTKKTAIVSKALKDSVTKARNAALKLESVIASNKVEETTLFEKSDKEKPTEEGSSAANLKSILNSLLAKAIENRMAPATVSTNRRYLRYQTGRFAESAKVDYVEPSATGKLTNIGYSYKYNPYKDLYTKTGKYAGSGIGLFFSARGRDVQYIIQSAIQDIAKNLISNKLSIKPI